jgi:hypothetical protein
LISIRVPLRTPRGRAKAKAGGLPVLERAPGRAKGAGGAGRGGE